MKAIGYSELRQNLSEAMISTIKDREPLLVTRQKGKSCVLMSLEEYESLEETAYLLRSPENAKHLINSIEELHSGKGIIRELQG